MWRWFHPEIKLITAFLLKNNPVWLVLFLTENACFAEKCRLWNFSNCCQKIGWPSTVDSISSFEKIFDTKCDFWIFKSLKFCMICDWLEVKKLTIHQFLIGNVAINERKPLKIFSKYFQLICYNSSAVGGASEKRF